MVRSAYGFYPNAVLTYVGQACCLPCPATDWLYPSNFYSLTRIAGYVNVVGLALCVFMLVSFAVLPLEKTKRHYLNVCLLLSIVFLELGFIVPWAQTPQQCYNAITPNDMYSSMTCAWGGALIVFGGVAVNMWILIRAFSMHLQICWDIVPGKVFFWGAQSLGWLISVLLLSTEMSMSGVSFRFGDYCHVNHPKSLETFWGPLLGLAGLSLLLQLATFIYCLHVYLKHSFGDYKPDTESSFAQSSVRSTRSANARAVFRRVKKVVSLQWRGLAIAILVLVDVIFFSVVFVVLDNHTQKEIQNPESFVPWLTCIVLTGGDKGKCLPEAEGLVVNQPTLIATLLMLAVVGIEAFVLICRTGMITGWAAIFKRPFGKKEEQPEFVSIEARRISANPRQYELLNIEKHTPSAPQPVHMASASGRPASDGVEEARAQQMENDIKLTNPYIKELQRSYRVPSRSFSNPRPPSSRSTVSWDPPPTAGTEAFRIHPTLEEERV